MRRRQDQDDNLYYDEEDEPAGRWGRGPSKRRRLLWVLLGLLVIPLLLGAGVAIFAGRSIAFEGIRRMTDRKFPDGKWVTGAGLIEWQADAGRAQPVLLDARTEEEFSVSHLRGAARIDPYRPSLRLLRGFPKDTAIVLYSSVGYRGARVANFLERQGYTQVYNLDGGQFRWVNDGHPVYRQDQATSEVHPYNPTWGLLLQSRYRIKAPPLEKKSAAP